MHSPSLELSALNLNSNNKIEELPTEETELDKDKDKSFELPIDMKRHKKVLGKMVVKLYIQPKSNSEVQRENNQKQQ